MTTRTKRPAAKRSFREIWTEIASAAEELQLAVGDHLPAVRELARQIGVKPTVIRDALLQAQAMGAVRIVPRIGAFLAIAPREAIELVNEGDSPLSAPWGAKIADTAQVLHVLDTRRLIEVELIGRSAKQRRLEDLLPAREVLEAMLQLPADAPRMAYIELDFRFHTELARPAGNEVLLAMQRSFQDWVSKRFIALPANLEQRSLSDQHHSSIYAAVAAGDVERARREMHEHLSIAYDFLVSTLAYPPQPEKQNLH